ncbi:class I SAM-dependent methyltransferase [Amycolatopsis sp. FDAARGOS 1241]|uniref:class I SAM-dependent methyltransferase n=1 Tax=Amycolatopsis sp. FDAARGOS 1241 TaxID=2778070 RepID=UPI0019529EA4|nr:class I SAM-dependent methyltransferase [Amycolatopsis sp. FDAARGOS 1241]QRP42670.1 class I SAM-dependent methyltransferase [Amycolatopsis sp. FDAARGOS 1241]
MSPLAEDGLPRAQVPAAFDTEAASYDRLVGANPGYHDHLRLSARRLGLTGGGAGLQVLDAGCGTGASTAALLEVLPDAEITAFDGSAAMLAWARRKDWPPNVRFVHSTIESLGRSGITGPFDAVLAAYLIRNLADPDTQLRALRALLRPGAPIAVHDYSVADSRRARFIWNCVCAAIIIPWGKVTTGDATLYRHLRRSVLRFEGTGALTTRIAAAGFTATRCATMPGWQRGIVHTVVGVRPGETP